MFLGSKVTADGDCIHEIKRRLLLVRKVMTNLDSILKSRDITLPTKVQDGQHSQGYGFSSGHEWLWELDYKESWVQKNWCFWTVMLEKSLVFTGRTDVEAEAPILWPPHTKSWLIWKDADAGKDWGREEKGMTEDEMVELCHRLNGHEFEQAPGVGDGWGGLACCSPRGRKEPDTTKRLNWTELSFLIWIRKTWGAVCSWQILIPNENYIYI